MHFLPPAAPLLSLKLQLPGRLPCSPLVPVAVAVAVLPVPGCGISTRRRAQEHWQCPGCGATAMPACSAMPPLPWDSLAPGPGTGSRGDGAQSPRMGTVLPISHRVSELEDVPQAGLLMWDRMGRTAGAEQGWGPCPAGSVRTEFLLPATKFVQSFSIWQRLLGHTAGYSRGHLGVGSSPSASDPSHHDPGTKPRTDTFPDGTETPGSPQDLQRGSSAWWGPCRGSL